MPLQFDIPLDELYTYQGTNPRPADFDRYWDSAIAEMHAVNSDIKLIKADFQTSYAECYHLYFTGVGGARIHAKFLRPKQIESSVGAVLMFHGYSMNSGDWFDKLPYVAAGYIVAAMDVRGQGGYSQDVGGHQHNTLEGHIIRGLDGEPEDLLYRSIFLDTAQLARIIMQMPEVDQHNVSAMGASQGGGLTLACAALEPRIRKIAPVYPFLSDYQRVWAMDLAVDAYNELQTYFRRFDPTHAREQDIFSRLGYIDVQHLAPRIEAETLMAVGLMDTICPPSTQFAAYNKITAPKNLRLYPDFAHENLPQNNDAVYQFMTRPD